MGRMSATLAQRLHLRDRYGRVARDLRISLTDRCTLRCTYCMPAEGLEWLPGGETLTDGEITRLIRIAMELLGVEEVRFTGGEPLLRRSLENIVAAVAGLRTRTGSRPEISLTTNGLGLARRAGALRAAGLDRVNISLDAVDPVRYAQIARRDRLADVLAGIAAAAESHLLPVKINTVLMRGVNEDQAVPLLRFALARGHQLRFIEQMLLGPRHTWRRDAFVPATEIRALLASTFQLTPVPRADAAAPASLWEVAPSPGLPGGLVGIIASVSEPFCGSCDRTRVTADGQLRTCLFSRTETDLRGPLRSGWTDEEIASRWAGATWSKPAGHGIDDDGFEPPARTMSAIGG